MPISSSVSLGALPPWLEQHYQNIAGRAQLLSRQDYQPYGLNRLAVFSPDIQEAHRLGRVPNIGQGAIQRSQEALGGMDYNFPAHANEYMSPYISNVVNEIGTRGARNFQENILPKLEATFVGLGQHGSSRHKDLALRAARDIQSEILGRQREALESGYKGAGERFAQDQARRVEAARELSNLGLTQRGMHMANVEQLGRQGIQQQEQQQRGYDIAFEDAMRQRQFPWEQANRYASMVQGLPVPSGHSSYSYEPAPRGPNAFGQIGSLAGQLLSARMMQPQYRKRGGHIMNPAIKKSSITKPNYSGLGKRLKAFGSSK